MNSFFHALTFMTRIPVPFHLKPQGWNQSAVYYPLVGFVIGCFLAVCYVLSHLFLPTALASVLIVGGWLWMTGGLHFDGLMDTADGIGSARTRERMIEIMKDSRVGAMGVLVAIMVLFGKIAAVYTVLTEPYTFTTALCFLIPPTLARAGILLSFAYWPYLHKEDRGLASDLIKGLTPLKRRIALFAVTGFLLLTIGPWAACGILLIWGAFVTGCNRYIVKRLGGLSGDTYGALVECSEVLLITVFSLYLYHGGTLGW